jgi:hypothetical protein
MRKSVAALTVGAALSATTFIGSTAGAAQAVEKSAPATCAADGSGAVIVTTTALTVRTGPGIDYGTQADPLRGGDVLFCHPAQHGWIEIYRKQGFGYVTSTHVADY